MKALRWHGVKDIRVEDIEEPKAERGKVPAVISLMVQGYFSAEKIITKKIKLDEVIEEGFDALLKERNQVKILVKAE